MEYRTLGRTGFRVGVIGLGTEHLRGRPRETVVSVVESAIAQGVNYLDLVFNVETYLGNLHSAIEGQRERVILACHLGSSERKGQYHKTRSLKECERVFLRTLSLLDTDYVDILNVHFIQSEKEYQEVLARGIVDLAHRLKAEGKAHAVGMSTHDPVVAAAAARSGFVDVIMIQVNLTNNAMPRRNEMLSVCAKEKVGVVAMKPFAGGKLLRRNKTVQISRYQTGWKSIKKKIPSLVTPVQCMSYVLSQVGVCTAVPGIRSVEELESALAFLDASDEEKDFSALLEDFKEYITGECVYCNHCLPCPSFIDVGQVMQLLDTVEQGVTRDLQEQYDTLPVRASACIRCGACVERCPFGVDVISQIEQAAKVFE